MFVVLPFYSKDAWLAAKNLKHWIAMDGRVDYKCLLAYDKETDAAEVKGLAEQYFCQVDTFTYDPPPKKTWPHASNHVFGHVARHVAQKYREPWLWVESDSVALKPGWIKAIDDCHKKGGKPFTGHWNHSTNVWNGVSVYPPRVGSYSSYMLLCDASPWDVVASKRDKIFQHLNVANHLFQHIWADPHTEKPYSFKSWDDVNNVIRPGVVLFHRCKDGSLTDLLQTVETKKIEDRGVLTEKDFLNPLVVIPFCQKDIETLKLTLNWTQKLNPFLSYRCLLVWDATLDPVEATEVLAKVKGLFDWVYPFVCPEPPNKQWPYAPNFIFKTTANYVQQHFRGVWFWWEPDAIPLKKDWLLTLTQEMAQGGKPFMGHIVQGMGHMNGVGFYPCKLNLYYTYTNEHVTSAWDYEMTPQVIKNVHKANHLIQHIWNIKENGAHSNFSDGEPLTFKTMADVDKWIDKRAVLFHRSKDGSLAKLLFEHSCQPTSS